MNTSGSIPDPLTSGLARRIRVHTARMTHRARASHIGACYSIADIVAVLYGAVLRIDPKQPTHPDRDRLILSKGHAGAIVFAALAERGFFPLEWLDRYCADGSPLAGHIVHTGVPGVEASTGALGHGLPIATGMAWSLAADRSVARVYCILGDGELNEGSVWEAALFAAHHRLSNLCAIVDVNGQQGLGETAKVIGLEPLAEKWRALNFRVLSVDGHDHRALHETLSSLDPVRPTVVLARTVKGKGVTFMEGQLSWHYRSLDDALLDQALEELGE